MSDLASSLVSSRKSKERCVNAILSAESNVEDARLAYYRDGGLVQVILCDMGGMALLGHSLSMQSLKLGHARATCSESIFDMLNRSLAFTFELSRYRIMLLNPTQPTIEQGGQSCIGL